jgi:hypothetical protein
MNILKFLESLSSEDLTKTTASRRESFGQFGKIGENLAFASIPFGLAALSNKSYANDIPVTPSDPVGALSLAFILEYLKNEFYETALSTIGLILPGRERNVFTQIGAHEADHVTFLKNGLIANGAPVPEKPTFDFTVNGAFNPFGDYQTFLQFAQAVEDTGVRAYKRQAGNLISTPDLLTYALQIHSVEARRASEVRRIRGLKGWISNDVSRLNTAFDASYAGEGNTTEAGSNTAAQFGAAAGSESFDEPLNTQQSVDIANIFIV